MTPTFHTLVVIIILLLPTIHASTHFTVVESNLLYFEKTKQNPHPIMVATLWPAQNDNAKNLRIRKIPTRPVITPLTSFAAELLQSDKMIREDELFKEFIDRITDVGHTYIIRDIVSAIFEENASKRIYLASLATAGLAAVLMERAGEAGSSHPASSNFLLELSKLTGVGVALAGSSYDWHTLLSNGRCLEGFLDSCDVPDDPPFNLILEIFGAGLGISVDIFTFLNPQLGSSSAILEAVWTVLAQFLKLPKISANFPPDHLPPPPLETWPWSWPWQLGNLHDGAGHGSKILHNI